MSGSLLRYGGITLFVALCSLSFASAENAQADQRKLVDSAQATLDVVLRGAAQNPHADNILAGITNAAKQRCIGDETR